MTSALLNNNIELNLSNGSAFSQFVKSKSVGDVLQKVKPGNNEVVLFDLPVTSTMEQAFDLLLAEDILTIPIYEMEGNKKKYVAIVSALDLLKLLSAKKVSLTTLSSDALLMPLSEAFGHTESLTVLKPSDTLSELVQLFSHQHHRVLIQLDSMMTMLSQMDLIRFFQAYNHQLGSDMLDKPIHDIQSSPIEFKLNYKATAAEAFLKLGSDRNKSGLPIVDDQGYLIGELSARDLRGLNRKRWDSLSKPVVMFLKSSHGDLYPPLTCHDKFTLSQVMTSFVLRKTHRLWWMDYQTGELKGVITLTDILATFASYC